MSIASPKQELSPEERRTSVRHQVQLRARVKLPCGQELVGHTVDISTGGMALILPDMEFVGEECVVRLDLAVCGSEECVELVGRVMHCTKVSGGYRAGMQFARLSDAAAKFLRAVLR